MVARLVGELLLAMGAPWHKGTVNTPARMENQVEKREIKWTPGLCFCFVGTMGVTIVCVMDFVHCLQQDC